MRNAKLRNRSVAAICPSCHGVVTSFDFIEKAYIIQAMSNGRHIFHLAKCAGCGRGALAIVEESDSGVSNLCDFFPRAVSHIEIPKCTPHEISNELRESELCACHGAYRAASALLRSTLEKTLKENGYSDTTMTSESRRSNLYQRIELARDDGIISQQRWDVSQNLIRTLGNDVLHGDWREVTSNEYRDAHRYVQRILEDFYDRRDVVEKILKDKGRI